MNQSSNHIRSAAHLFGVSVLLATASDAATVTFESDQGYLIGDIHPSTNGGLTGSPYDGQQGWSRSTSSNRGLIVSTTSSGEYVGGQAVAASDGGTYIGGMLGGIAITGINSITFDALGVTGIQVGFLGDNGNGLFDQSPDTGMSFGVAGSGSPRIQARFAGFGTDVFNPAGAAGSFTQWFRYSVEIGESTGGLRDITMSVRNLTSATDVNLGGQGGNWTFSVTDAQFGVAPENADGIWMRVTEADEGGGNIDNLNYTIVPEPATAVLSGLGLLAFLRRRRTQS